MKGPICFGVGISLFTWAAIAIADTSLDSRVARLERILSVEGPSQLLLQVQRLQQEVQELRGLLESQQHAVERLERRIHQLDPPPAVSDGDEAIDPPSGTEPTSETPLDLEERQTETTPPTGEEINLPFSSPETTAASEQAIYRHAFTLLRQRRYGEASDQLEALLQRYPDGQHTDDALFWLGETAYVQRDYAEATAYYDRLIASHPQSPRLPSAMLKIGSIHQAEGRPKEARAVLEEIAKRYPSSTEARLAKERLQRINDSGAE